MYRDLLGKEIKRRRVELKLTQKQLALGICKQSIISKIENGEFFPSFELLVTLSNKLNLSISYLFESAVSDQYHYINRLKNELNYLIKKRKYSEAFVMADKELRSNNFLQGEQSQFLLWVRTVSAFETKQISLVECIDILEKCLSEKIDYINQSQKMMIHNSLAAINADIGNYEIAFKEYEKILLEFKNESDTLLYIRVLFNYANDLHTCKQFNKALETLSKALEICKKVENVNMLGKCYFLKGECYIDLGFTKEEISKCFNKSLFYFDMMHNDDYIKFLWDTYYEYL